MGLHDPISVRKDEWENCTMMMISLLLVVGVLWAASSFLLQIAARAVASGRLMLLNRVLAVAVLQGHPERMVFAEEPAEATRDQRALSPETYGTNPFR